MKRLKKVQKEFIKEVFVNSLTQSQAMKMLEISPADYQKWLNEPPFRQELQNQMESALREGKMLIIRHCSLAAAKLISLANSEKEETARKACLDIIQTAQACIENQKIISKTDNQQQPQQISNGQAAQILEILAQKS